MGPHYGLVAGTPVVSALLHRYCMFRGMDMYARAWGKSTNPPT